MKRLKRYGAVAAFAIGVSAGAHAQISDNSVRIGILNDMSGP